MRHRFWYGIAQRIRWSRGAFRETPAGRLPPLSDAQAERVAALSRRYQVRFESRMTAATSLNNYEYLDILDRAWTLSGLARPNGRGVLCDVGCASFWYAAALQSFFVPAEMVGVEIEGYRLFRDGRSRIDYAQGYLADLPNARYVVADYRSCQLAADTITCWFPFVGPAAILAWRLPLSLLAPEALFSRVYHNLREGGQFVMVNHGEEEATVAAALCSAAGFSCTFRDAQDGPLSRHRLKSAVLSRWVRG
jgi:SAM-dependent methyltransferase